MPKTKSGQVKLVLRLKPTLHQGKASQAGEFSLVQIQVLVHALIITEDLLAHGQGQLCPKLPEESPQVILTPPRVNQSSPLPTAAHVCPRLDLRAITYSSCLSCRNNHNLIFCDISVVDEMMS